MAHFAHYLGGEVAAKNPSGYSIDKASAEAAFKAIEAWQGSAKNSLILAGSKGNGKTTIARALYLANKYFAEKNAVGEARQYRHPCWVTEKQILGMVEAGKDDAYEMLERRQVLFVDDLGEAATEINRYGTIKTPAVDLLEVRYAKRLCTIITTNLNLDAIKEKYGARVEDRLRETCEVVGFNNQSFRK